MIDKVRIDKWLWTVRIFKSRSIATLACKSGKVKIGSSKCKPARNVVVGDFISVEKEGIKLEFKILELLKSRLAFSIAKEAYEDLTSEDEIKKIRAFHHRRLSAEYRERGLGRPTKRDRREIKNFKEIDQWLDQDFPYDFEGDE